MSEISTKSDNISDGRLTAHPKVFIQTQRSNGDRKTEDTLFNFAIRCIMFIIFPCPYAVVVLFLYNKNKIK